MQRNFKRELQENERIDEIQHSNTLLVARMMSISAGDPKYRQPLYQSKHGRDSAAQAADEEMDASLFQSVLPKTDFTARQREKKIEHENQLIFQRIVGTTSVYKDQFAEKSSPR